MSQKMIASAMFAAALSFGSLASAQTTTTTTGPAATPQTTMPGSTTPNTGTSNAPVVSGTSSATNNAVSTQPQNNSGAPVPGANSFTEGQARDRMQERGYTSVSDLKLDGQGIWRGKAMRNGQSTEVSMDYQGNVVPQ